MDKIRVVLIACLLIATFSLVIRYADFRDDINKQQLQSQHQVQNTHSNNNHNLNELENLSNSDDEIPTAPKASNAIEVQESKTKEKSNNHLIKVETDTFLIEINPKGGDIERVALPKHLSHIDMPDIPFQLLENSANHTYIAQSGLIGQNGTDTSMADRPLFSSAQSSYQLRDGQEELQVDLHFKQGDVDIIKRFTFKRGDYLIAIDYLINNQSQEDWQAAIYGQIRHDGRKASSDNRMGLQPYLGFATTTSDERFKKISFDDISKKSFSSSEEGGWIALLQHYFVGAWIPQQDVENEFSTLKTQSGIYLGRYKSPLQTVKAGESGVLSTQFYAGPKDQYRLAELAPRLDLSVDYGWLWMIAQPLYAILYFINNGTLHVFGFVMDMFGGVGNWAISIILLTILVKLAFFSLNAKAFRSMAKMRKVQPKMMEIRERYSDDRQKQSQEMMALYSKEKINPLGGCLPILVQMPVFIALYWVLMESVELRHAPFIGYIKDLSAMDPYFILPAFMGFTMWIQQKLNPAPTDPMQAKVMQFLPIIFTFFFLWFPAGLVLYWVVNNILSIAQQWIITRQIEAEET